MNGYAISKTLYAFKKSLKSLLVGQSQIDLKGKSWPQGSQPHEADQQGIAWAKPLDSHPGLAIGEGEVVFSQQGKTAVGPL